MTLLVVSSQNLNAQVDKQTVPKIISGGIINGKAISLPKPAYSAAARAVKAIGRVLVSVVIDKKGNVESAKIISGHPLLRRASVRAASKAKFKPTQLQGKTVHVKGVIVYYFGKRMQAGEKQYPYKNVITPIVNGYTLSLPKPAYPSAAKAVCARGIVKVKIEIDSNGNVGLAQTLGGHPLLRRSSVKAAKNAKFPPNKMIKRVGILVYNFMPFSSQNCDKTN